ncbi:hypothetical protein FA13DRAFT_1791037 [Coprinellus micaceus]|uniref:DASH complex subunit SPC19 n=1 Tax=Coprinellus micaceus TaxID=71717 RepID=A0A4Y7TDJ3_COPMI|nr:hypothetical protein FA13DRAFT_1791037 [Coprinellus micaceus]
MSRLSRLPLKGRESVFTGGPEQYIGDAYASCPPSLEECVAAMEDCCEEAYEAQLLLRNGTKDLPRMTKVLENEKVFLLVTESTVRRYQSALIDEIEPNVSALISKAEQGLSTLEKKESSLQSKIENAQSRARAPTVTTAVQKSDARRLNLMVKQRERLEQQVRAMEEEILELERKA